MNNTKIIAFYLPQFHPFPENDEWWGKGFTEWTNVGKATPLFPGHYQPKVPSELGYYDLRLPEIAEQQVQLAKEAGVTGFCYWHYWFEKGKELMEMPFYRMLETGSPNFPFCVGWANESWLNKQWNADGTLKAGKILIEQKYGGEEDYIAHFEKLLPAFKDPRYISIENKPLVFIHRAEDLPKEVIEVWNRLAKENGFSGIFFVGRIPGVEDVDVRISTLKANGFESVCIGRLGESLKHQNTISRLIRHLLGKLRYHGCVRIVHYEEDMKYYIDEKYDKRDDVFPTIYPNWDHSPRSKEKGLIINDSTPELFYSHSREALSVVKEKTESRRVVFLKSWNEWGEGNYMEPDLKFGRGYINALKKAISSFDD